MLQIDQQVLNCCSKLNLLNYFIGNLAQPNNSNIIGIIAVIKYFIKQISIHRHQEMCDELEDLLKKVKNEKVREILENVSGFETF